jgi:hypothetical protein
VALLAGCSAPSVPQSVTVHWQLVDGRSCLDAAVVSISISGAGGDPTSQLCPADPSAQGSLLVPSVPPGAQLSVSGLSGSNTVLYRGQVAVPDPVPPQLDVILYYTGGQ